MSDRATAATEPAEPTDWPGRGLGLPAAGPGSMGRVGRRFAALAVDWAACSLLSAAFLGYDSWATLLLFVAENVLLVGLLGGSFGHVLLGLRVHRLRPGAPVGTTPAGPLPAVVRTALLALVVPALVPDGHGRGLHDRAAGTVLLRR